MNYVNLQRSNGVSLSRQLYEYYKEEILSGRLAAGRRLPATRTLAKELNIARNAVIDCYEQLLAEGYVYAVSGSGTFVSEGVVYQAHTERSSKTEAETDSKTGMQISFRTGIPDLYQIPVAKWAQVYKRCIEAVTAKELDYQDTYGSYSLRLTLAKYLARARGVKAEPRNIVITSGAAQAFSILSKVVTKEEYALVENPLSRGILYTLQQNQVIMKPIPVDEYGMVTTALKKEPPKLVFTTPSHQFPLGVVLPINRRIQLIQYARAGNAYIVEDDYDSEFRFDGKPIPSMQSLAPDRVIYVGTFSKTLMPALRVGYMVVPESLLAVIRDIKYVDDLHSPTLEQTALAEFIRQGYYERHISRMRRWYERKRNYLIACLTKEFGQRVRISGEEAGLHLVAHFQGIIFEEALLTQIRKQGIEISPVSRHYLGEEPPAEVLDALLFGYGNTPMEQMEEGVHILAKVLYKERS